MGKKKWILDTDFPIKKVQDGHQDPKYFVKVMRLVIGHKEIQDRGRKSRWFANCKDFGAVDLQG